MRLFFSVVFTILGSLFFANATTAQTGLGSSFNEMMSNFADDPLNYRLHISLISVAREQKPFPKIPKEARELFDSASKKLSGQPTNQSKESAAKDLKRAVALAPWWGNAVYNLGFAFERLDKKALAGRMYAIYILTEPSPLAIDEARKRIITLAGEESQLLEKVESKRISAQQLLDVLEGAVYDCGKDENYFYYFVMTNRVPTNVRVEHTRPKVSNDPMTMLPIPGPALEFRGMTVIGLGSTGFHRTVSPEAVVSKYNGNGSTQTCGRIRTF